MKLKNLIQRIFCKDLLDRVEKLEENASNLTVERDDLRAKLEAAELAYNMLFSVVLLQKINSKAFTAFSSALSKQASHDQAEEATL